MSQTYQVRTATATWTVSINTNALTILADGKQWPAHAMPATCSNGCKGYLWHFDPAMWNWERDNSPFGERPAYIVARPNGSVASKDGDLNEALAKAEGKL